jgi:hypothetical protein
MSKIRKSARGEDCTINLPGVCNYNPETVVWCHSNRYEHGKGMGLKAKDEHGAYGCSECHATYDRQKNAQNTCPWTMLKKLLQWQWLNPDRF